MQISLLGCGWLGLPLAESFIEKGFTVKGSVTSPEKLELLKSKGIQPYLISLTSTSVNGEVAQFLNKSDILIIDIPPKLRKEESESFIQKIEQLIPYIEQAVVSKVLFVSSISVYGQKNDGIVTENTPPFPDTESGKQLLETEKILASNTKFKTTSLRFAGLYGGERHPVYHLAGKQNLQQPNAPINLIDRKNCIGVIEAVINKNAWGEVFNAALSQHPTRKEYYTQKAQEMQLPLPEFMEDNNTAGKIISSQKIKTVLGYSL
ncbi:SDR family oxidoreductase [Flavobacterium sp. ST-75]|uniref:SDR family oxidoreductase n=1 Tax=Flavobacterium rhizophilum TaxID=3163296 RepID=A0ABW8YBS4_9FLAO